MRADPEPDLPSEPASADLPCPAPPGGWKAQGFTPADSEVIAAYQATHPDVVVGYKTDTHQRAAVVAVSGDLPTARQELRKVYRGNLCVIAAPYTAAQLRSASDQISAAMAGGLGPISVAVNPVAGRIDVRVVARNAAVNRLIAPFPAGLVHVTAVVRPLD